MFLILCNPFCRQKQQRRRGFSALFRKIFGYAENGVENDSFKSRRRIPLCFKRVEKRVEIFSHAAAEILFSRPSVTPSTPFRYSFEQRFKNAWAKSPYSRVISFPDLFKSSATYGGTNLLKASLFRFF